MPPIPVPLPGLMLEIGETCAVAGSTPKRGTAGLGGGRRARSGGCARPNRRRARAHLTGQRLIGVDEGEAWRLTTKTGLDSMPAARLRALEYLLKRGDLETTTTDVAIELGLPNPTTHRTLGDLAAHAVLSRESQGPGKPDRWRIAPWAAERYGTATTSSKMSEPTI